MKKSVFSIIVLLILSVSYGQVTEWGFDAAHAKVGFSVSHFGISETEGKFTKFGGKVLSDRPDFSDAKIDFTIEVSSIDTEEPQRDAHLRSPDFFDVEKYSQITFKSKSLKSVGTNSYQLTGELTMHGVTREVMLAVVVQRDSA